MTENKIDVEGTRDSEAKSVECWTGESKDERT